MGGLNHGNQQFSNISGTTTSTLCYGNLVLIKDHFGSQCYVYTLFFLPSISVLLSLLDDAGDPLRLLFEFLETMPGLDPALPAGLAVEQEQYTHTFHHK